MKKRPPLPRRRRTQPRGPITIVGPSSVGGVFGDEVVTATIMPTDRMDAGAWVEGFRAVDEVYMRMSQALMDERRARVERELEAIDALLDGRLTLVGWDRGPIWQIEPVNDSQGN